MSWIISGRIDFAGQFVDGAAVVLELDRAGDVLELRQGSSRQGVFGFRLTGQEDDGGPATARLWVRDRAGMDLGDPLEIKVTTGTDVSNLGLLVDPARLEESDLSIWSDCGTILSDATLSTLFEAARLVDQTWPEYDAEKSLQGFLATLPGAFRDPDLGAVALGALRGHGTDLQDFADRFAEMALWSARNGMVSPDFSRESAEELLSAKEMSVLAERLSAIRPQRAPIARKCSFTPLGLAALRIFDGDALASFGALAVLDHHLSVLGACHRIFEAAGRALQKDDADLRAFASQLAFLSGWAIPSPGPFPRDIPGGFGPPGQGGADPGFPTPQRPAGPPWPVGLGAGPLPGGAFDPSDFIAIPERAEMWACLAEARLSRLDQDLRVQLAEITAIDPANACPGHRITVRGRGFRYEDAPELLIHFSGARRGTRVTATVSNPSDTEFTVVVPDGAHCGPIEIEVPGSARFVPACGDNVPLHAGLSRPFRFQGGETALTSFRLIGGRRCHFEGGSEIRVNWTTCNATDVSISLTMRGRRLQFFPRLSPVTGPLSIRLPEFDTDTEVTVWANAQGPCGSDWMSEALLVRRRIPAVESLPLSNPPRFDNWHRNIRRGARVFNTSDVDRIVDIVRAAGRDGARIGTMGSGWSYSDCVTGNSGDVPDWLIRMDCATEGGGATIDLTDCILETAVPAALRSDIRSVLTPEQLALFVPAAAGLPVHSVPPVRDRLVHVKAGMKLAHLNWFLDGLPNGDATGDRRLAMATLGGSNGQSIAGAINTGTHGTNAVLPPIQDFVRAIHLIGPGGQQWWIEPDDAPITDASVMNRLKREGYFDPCLELVYSRVRFDAVLVSMGAAGIVHSLVIEAVPKHNLASTTDIIPYRAFERYITDTILGPTPPFFAEFVIAPRDRVYRTLRTPVHRDSPPIGVMIDSSTSLALGALATRLIAAVPVVLSAIPLAIAELVAAAAIPIIILIVGPEELERRIRLLREAAEVLPPLFEALHRHDDGEAQSQALADALVHLLNVLELIEVPGLSGSNLVDDIHDLTILMQRPPGTTSNTSFGVYNGQTSFRAMTHGTYERLIQSYEYVMDAADVLAFVRRVRALAARVRDNDPLIVTINVRFTQGTRAMMGMQQFPLTGYVEIWTPEGLDGNDSFHEQLEQLAADAGVVPHWGHYHRRFRGGQSVDFAALYPRFRIWQAELWQMARTSPTDPYTFRSGFVHSRGLLADL